MTPEELTATAAALTSASIEMRRVLARHALDGELTQKPDKGEIVNADMDRKFLVQTAHRRTAAACEMWNVLKAHTLTGTLTNPTQVRMTEHDAFDAARAADPSIVEEFAAA